MSIDKFKPDAFRGDPRDEYVIAFTAAMTKCGRLNAALQTVSAFVKCEMPVWSAQQTLAQLTLAINHIPHRRRNSKPKLTTIDGGKK
jgi:hypothetical protein